MASYTHVVLLKPNFHIWGFMCFYRSSHHLNLHILVVHLLEEDGEMLFLSCEFAAKVQRLCVICLVMKMVLRIYKRLGLKPAYSGCPLLLSKCVMFEVLTTILSF